MSDELQQIKFITEDLQKVLIQIIESVLGPKQYDERQVPRWINQINETVMAKFVELQRPFKILINTLIMQRKGANVSITHNNHWDTAFDESQVVTWPKEKPGKSDQSKETIQCMVSIYALSILNGMSYSKNQL